MMEWFNVGRIVNTHGIRGEVRVFQQLILRKNVSHREVN